MSKKNKRIEVTTINQEIQLVQIERFINDFNNAMKKELTKGLKKIALGIGPLVLSLVVFAIFKNPTLLVIGAGITSVSGIVIMSKDIVKEIKKINSTDNRPNSNIINIEQEKDVDQILQDGIKIKGEDLYTEKYELAVEREKSYSETEEYKKYKEAFEKQKHKNNSNIKVVGRDGDYLNKEETMIQLIREIDTYILVYKLPPLDISNKEWELFFDTTYSFFNKKGIKNEFYEMMSQIEKYVFAKVLVYKKRKINIYDFIENLYYLESSTIDKKEIEILKQEILSKIPKSVPVDISNILVKTKIK